MSKEYTSSSCKQIEDVNYFFLRMQKHCHVKIHIFEKINKMLPRLSII